MTEKIFAPDDRKTPAVAINDGVDCVPMKTWKAFLIQLLNIAGTGPIFGALTGAVFGPVVFLWIVFGSILGGAVSGFHATQSPMIAKCIKSKKDGRKIFYGAMISESVIALVWAAAGVAFYGTTQLLTTRLQTALPTSCMKYRPAFSAPSAAFLPWRA